MGRKAILGGALAIAACGLATFGPGTIQCTSASGCLYGWVCAANNLCYPDGGVPTSTASNSTGTTSAADGTSSLSTTGTAGTTTSTTAGTTSSRATGTGATTAGSTTTTGNTATIGTTGATTSGGTGSGSIGTTGTSGGTSSGSIGTTGGPSMAACAAIANFRGTAFSATAISLAWTGGTNISPSLFRKTLCGTDSYVQVAALDAGASVFTDTTVTANYVYWYELTAMDPQGNPASLAIPAQASPADDDGCAGGPSDEQPSDVPASQICPSGG